MAKTAKIEDAPASPTPQPFDREAAAASITELLSLKAEQQEAQGVFAKATRDKADDLGVVPGALSLALRLRRMEESKGQAFLCSALRMADAAGLFNQADLEGKAALDVMREIVRRLDNGAPLRRGRAAQRRPPELIARGLRAAPPRIPGGTVCVA